MKMELSTRVGADTLICLGYLRDGMRHGPGVQVWPDGAKYEGEWKFNKANGKGKFWHADGDVYEGDWEDDKANGFGVYIHVNGARYEGQWKNDLQDGWGLRAGPMGPSTKAGTRKA